MLLRDRRLIYPALLLLLCSVLYFPYLGAVPFFDKGEPREAMAVQGIIRRGDWLVPLKRSIDVPSKPPLFHWAAALVSQSTGKLNEKTMRLPSAVFATLGVLLLYFFARQFFTLEAAVLAGVILASTMVYQDQAVDARVDMTLCFVVLLSLTLFYFLASNILRHPGWYYVFFVVTGIGTLAKGPVSILLIGLVAGFFLIITRRWDVIRILPSSRRATHVDTRHRLVRYRRYPWGRGILHAANRRRESKPFRQRFRP